MNDTITAKREESETVIEFDHVNWKYADTEIPALREIDFKVNRGEFIGIIGVNDSGKTSLCRLCNGLIPHSFTGELSGNVRIEGEDVRNTQTARLAKRSGLVFPDPEAQLSQLTVFDELAFGPANLGLPKEEIIETVNKVLHLMDLDSMKSRSPYTLSGGEQQRVAIASVLAMNPALLVLDEPTSNLDPDGTKKIFQTMKDLNQNEGITVLLVEHEIELLAEYATRIIVLNQGKKLLDGTPREVFSKIDIFHQIGIHVPQMTQVSESAREDYGLWPNQQDPLTLSEMIDLLNL
ncbi:ABC transporter ATP-binding protein [Blautia liquoris]|jgi:energy-coupling factor transport system ATP-binding protein|uniref:ABC transporter ATP-binding protein n=1 Tax=Blautia liquoris TaxID=2779518 RepID=A0A7M2RKD7_9FIRM|nr:ABC transporter ATP-binding protein [Blautia liquoris]QOV20588.1 ABC transporter ATP-binding protein [Blautia liquoris]